MNHSKNVTALAVNKSQHFIKAKSLKGKMFLPGQTVICKCYSLTFN